jgi:cytochrome c-type biogenesis protein CcmH
MSSVPAAVSRRGFLAAAAVLAPAVAAGRAWAQTELPGSSMEGDGYRAVTLPPKPGASGPSMTQDQRDAVERQIACPCPCTLDIFTCRASMPCGFAPRLHRDVIALVESGYDEREILAAFTNVYGTAIRMAPPKSGFNLVGWLAPFAAIGVGGLGVLALLRRWQRPPAASTPSVTPIGVAASDEELRRLEAAVRQDRP